MTGPRRECSFSRPSRGPPRSLESLGAVRDLRLFDTTFLVDLVNADPGAAKLARKADEESSPSGMSAVSVHEYLFGIHFRYRREKGKLNEKIASAERDLSRFEIIPLSDDIARISSGLHAELATAGTQIGINDVYIAATAIKHNLPLVTRDRVHFQRIPRLNLETY